MGGSIAKAFKNIGKLDPFDITGRRKGREKAAASATDSARAAAATAAEQQAKQAEADKSAALKAKEEEGKKKLATATAESRRSAVGNYLAAQGSEQTSRRRFLVGAK